jgi:nucleotide-binding universal stress UspA family protein
MVKILVAVDGSAASLAAVEHTLHLSREGLPVQLVLANVQEPASLYELVVAHDAAVLEEVSTAAGFHLLAPAEALVRATDVAFESVVVSGDPAHALVDLIELHACNMVVMGGRGLGSMRSALLGSVSQTVLHHTSVPVTIIRHLAVEPPEAEDTDDVEATPEAAANVG